MTNASGWPEFNNSVIRNPASGVYKTNVNRFDAIEVWTIDLDGLTVTEWAYLNRMWRGGYGNGVGFRVKIFTDYTATLQPIGTIATSTTQAFNLTKTYTRPGVTARQDVRRITKPVVSTNLAAGSVTLYEPDGVTARIIEVPFVVTVGGASTGFTYTISNVTGILTVTTTTASGAILATFQFDVPMCMVPNTLNNQMVSPIASDVKGLTLRELLAAELGV